MTVGLGKVALALSSSERIAIDPAVLAGKPVVRGTRPAADSIIGLLVQGWSDSDVLRNYPGLSREDVAACLQYASEVLSGEGYPLETLGGARDAGMDDYQSDRW